MQSVRAVSVVRGTIRPGLVIPGAIAPFRVVALSNSINEPAQDVPVEEGDRVRAGQVLAQLDVDDLEASLDAAERTGDADDDRTSETAYGARLTIAQAPNQTRQAEAQVLQAQQTYDEAQKNAVRDEQLVAQGYLPQQNLDEQRVVVTTDRQAIASARAALQSAIANQQINGTQSQGLQASTVASARDSAAAQFATAEQIRREIARARITSPIDGVVINRNLNPGEYPAGRQIFTIEAIANVYAILTASAVQAYEVRVGDRVAISGAGLPEGRFEGRVRALLDAATPGSTNFTIKVAIPNPRGTLRAGTPVQAEVALRPTSGFVIPSSAFSNDERTHVIAIRDGRAHVRIVREIATDGANSVVAGLEQGERIVRDGSEGIDDGQQLATVR